MLTMSDIENGGLGQSKPKSPESKEDEIIRLARAELKAIVHYLEERTKKENTEAAREAARELEKAISEYRIDSERIKAGVYVKGIFERKKKEIIKKLEDLIK